MSELQKSGKPAKVKKAKRKRRVPPAVLRRLDAADYCGISDSQWDRMTALSENPEPISIGPTKMVAWSRHELAEWVKRGCPPRAVWKPIWKAILARR